LWLSRRSPDLAVEHERIELARPRGEGRPTGFPQLALAGGAARVVSTDVADGTPNPKGGRIVLGRRLRRRPPPRRRIRRVRPTRSRSCTGTRTWPWSTSRPD